MCKVTSVKPPKARALSLKSPYTSLSNRLVPHSVADITELLFCPRAETCKKGKELHVSHFHHNSQSPGVMAEVTYTPLFNRLFLHSKSFAPHPQFPPSAPYAPTGTWPSWRRIQRRLR